MTKKAKENEKIHDGKRQYYIVDKTILSASIQKVIAVNEMVKNEHISKHEGIRRTGLSRSTYYKYKDFIKPFFEGSQEKIFNIHMSLKDRQGLLAQILEVIADDKMNILTIVQNAAVDGIVQLTISLQGTAETPKNIETTLAKIQVIDGVRDLRILGSNS
ncbi:ACT domain protein [Fusobacterium gonidiaformans 3-1-5R]|uniref:ACT domain protein n=1 Tax=Fusobacterium gonidiaformans 3-1-5R TaxID=469605 RepID=E5BEG5_9FUSO|nr:ACT domain-containing protein [Fusobacterium gonidiaformans]AVQ17524.1 ACT domain-containing protein [Fusobacterium gonidiaformans ATCC 25563]EFS21441.1 ACT domain protein [Fusobacterium gonidiaformans 3-1-5R]EFS27687.1 hypothetical protein FGAG_00008 [Fusobacterium gonidiaformans ATCC 25563]